MNTAIIRMNDFYNYFDGCDVAFLFRCQFSKSFSDSARRKWSTTGIQKIQIICATVATDTVEG